MIFKPFLLEEETYPNQEKYFLVIIIYLRKEKRSFVWGKIEEDENVLLNK